MEKLDFYHRSAVIEKYRKYLINIFSNFSNVYHKIF